MIGLPAKFRIKIYNGTGVALLAGDVVVKVCFQKFALDGALTESAETTLFSSAGVANATYEAAGAWVTNTDKWVAFHGHVYSNVTGAPSGSIKVFLENSTAATPAGPTDGRAWLLLEIPYTAAGNSTRPIKT